jgi:hypothetical protein
VIKVRAEKDYWAGFLYLALGVAFLWFGRDYQAGSAARMGPGYFPMVLAFILGAIGVASIIRSLLQEGPSINGLAWRKVVIIAGGIIIFGLILEPIGLIFGLPILVIISALGSRETIFDIRSAAVLILLTAFCIGVFVKGLGVPMPIFGYWFDGVVPHTWQR